MQQHPATTVTVFSRPACVQCTATFRSLNTAGIEYDVQDAMEDANNTLIHSLDISSAPAVIVREKGVIVDSWGGFRPDKIEELVKARAEALVPA